MASETNTTTQEQKTVYKPFQWFFHTEVSGSVLLMAASVGAVISANTTLAPSYEHLLHLELALSWGHHEFSQSLLHWINDGLMALFFFTVGLEIKREVLVGELASTKMALLPIFAAIGGMVVPGIIYTAFNHGTPGMKGWGIPVATDIAFSLGAIAVLGRRLPLGLRIFLSAFAIADDLGAVIIIAVFYTTSISTPYLLASLGCLALLLAANLLYIRWLPVYIAVGLATWVCVLGSGIHATVAGVMVAMMVPARGKYNIMLFVNKAQTILSSMRTNRDVDSYWFSIFIKPEHQDSVHALENACRDVTTPLQRLEHGLHPWVVFLILPLFAFFNAGLPLHDMSLASAVVHPVTLGCFLGLLVGKPIGISLASYIAVRLGVASLPVSVRWLHIVGAGMLGGIGFTMSLFISGLSFVDPALLNNSKLGVLSGSLLSALVGLAFLTGVSFRERHTY